MRKFYLFIALLALAISVNAQLPEGWTPTPTTPVAPLIKTDWRSFGPQIKSPEGKVAVSMGCVNKACGQLFYYWKYPKKFEKFEGYTDDNFVVQLDPLDEYEPPYDKMPLKYEDKFIFDVGYFVLTPQWQIDIMTEFTKQVGYRNHTHYFDSGGHSASWTTVEVTWPYTVVEKFDSRDADGKNVDLKYFHEMATKWLQKGVPLICCGITARGHGDCWLIDGVDSLGRFHMAGVGKEDAYNGYRIYDYDLAEQLTVYGGAVEAWSYRFTAFAWLPNDEEAINAALGIKDVSVINGNRAVRKGVYNLQGKKVGDKLDGLPRGLYIMDGKKVLVK